jgi:hypothetical protein
MNRRKFIRGAVHAAPVAALSGVAVAQPALTDWQQQLLALTENLNEREAHFVLTAAEVMSNQAKSRLNII